MFGVGLSQNQVRGPLSLHTLRLGCCCTLVGLSSVPGPQPHPSFPKGCSAVLPMVALFPMGIAFAYLGVRCCDPYVLFFL